MQDDLDINKPVPLPKRYDPIAPLPEVKFKDYKPMKKFRRIKRQANFKPPKGDNIGSAEGKANY